MRAVLVEIYPLGWKSVVNGTEIDEGISKVVKFKWNWERFQNDEKNIKKN